MSDTVLSINTFGARFDIFNPMPNDYGKNILFMLVPGTISTLVPKVGPASRLPFLEDKMKYGGVQ